MKFDLRKFSYAIFDSDGTVFDSMGLYEKTFADLLKPFYIPEDKARKFYKATTGQPIDKQFCEMLNKRPGHEPKFTVESLEVQKLVENFFEITSQKLPPLFPDVKMVLNSLYRNHNFKLFLTSGTKTSILEERIKENGIDLFFELIGSEIIPKGLGHIEVFARVTKRKREEFCKKAFFVGDGPGDMHLAREAGIFAIGLTTTVPEEMLRQAGAQEIIHSLSQLIS